ncbi:MAG: AMIN domain-containing protein [Halodesulfovibrio sp.]|uniref:AMIN domain-containing protein n=1 Tax=Halodesulfovibrio sp. TaxID=1912772 RepID=UPI00359D9857
MNRNISMLILLALVVGTILIGYNKWIMKDLYTISNKASSRLTVNVGAQESKALQEVVIDKSTSDTLASAISDANSTTSSTAKVAPASASKATVVTSPKADTEKILTLVTKTVTIAEVRPVVEKKPSQQETVTSPESVVAKKKSDELQPLVSVSYADKKLTVFAVNKFTYKIFGLKEPDRFVVDVVGRFSEELPAPKVVQDGLVKTVRLGRHDDRVRIVLDLKGALPPNWSATQTNGTLSILMK